ncbi:hypothetical protein BC940DRAFT_329701 [Gongronella butleri]|nr:hypothetical protein BC940DRAFT_329701 [Gongronella butleri]
MHHHSPSPRHRQRRGGESLSSFDEELLELLLLGIEVDASTPAAPAHALSPVMSHDARRPEMHGDPWSLLGYHGNLCMFTARHNSWQKDVVTTRKQFVPANAFYTC